MPASLRATLLPSLFSLSRVETILNEVAELPPRLQRIAGEILLLRIANVLENGFSDIFRKLICGAPYLDGSSATIFVTAKSMSDAYNLILNYNRKSQIRHINWLLIKSIKEGCKHIIVESEHCIAVMDRYYAELDAIRVIRNHIAHSNSGTRKEYSDLLTSYYGPRAHTIPCGTMLMSRTLHGREMIRLYLIAARAVLRDLTKA